MGQHVEKVCIYADASTLIRTYIWAPGRRPTTAQIIPYRTCILQSTKLSRFHLAVQYLLYSQLAFLYVLSRITHPSFLHSLHSFQRNVHRPPPPYVSPKILTFCIDISSPPANLNITHRHRSITLSPHHTCPSPHSRHSRHALCAPSTTKRKHPMPTYMRLRPAHRACTHARPPNPRAHHPGPRRRYINPPIYTGKLPECVPKHRCGLCWTVVYASCLCPFCQTVDVRWNDGMGWARGARGAGWAVCDGQEEGAAPRGRRGMRRLAVCVLCARA